MKNNVSKDCITKKADSIMSLRAKRGNLALHVIPAKPALSEVERGRNPELFIRRPCPERKRRIYADGRI